MFVQHLTKSQQFAQDISFGCFAEGVFATSDKYRLTADRVAEISAGLERVLGVSPDARGMFLLDEVRFPLAKKLRRFCFLGLAADAMRPSERECARHPEAEPNAARPFPCRAYKAAGNAVYWALSVGSGRICSSIAGEIAASIAALAYANEAL